MCTGGLEQDRKTGKGQKNLGQGRKTGTGQEDWDRAGRLRQSIYEGLDRAGKLTEGRKAYTGQKGAETG
jgi:hypothetical protein